MRDRHFSLVYTFLSLSFVLLKDEGLEARSLQCSCFGMARSRKERAQEACNLLLLLLYCHIPPVRRQKIRTLQIVQEAELSEPFATANFRNRNVTLVLKERGITLHLQDYKTVRTAGKNRISIEVGCLLAETHYRT